MRRTIFYLTFAVIGAVALMAPTGAKADCPNGITFGQGLPASETGPCDGAGAYCTIVSPGINTQASLQGSFWALGSGSVTVGGGNDNGPADDTVWTLPYGSNFYILGDWAAGSNFDGCIDVGAVSTQAQVAAFHDTSADGKTGYMGIACVARDPGDAEGQQFDYDEIGRDFDLVAIPTPNITNTVVSGSQVLVTLGPPSFGAVYTDGSSLCNSATLITGYRVHTATVSAGSGDPATRTGATWAGVATVSGAGGTSFTTTACNTTENKEVYVALSPIYDSNFESSEPATGKGVIVGPSSRAILCGPTIATPGEFKLIDKKAPLAPSRRR